MGMSNNLFPIFLKLDKLNLLIVGAGKVGLEKISTVQRVSPGASVHVVAFQVSQEFRDFTEGNSKIKISEKYVSQEDLDGVDLIIAATDDTDTNNLLREWAHSRKILVNFADKPEICDFYLGAVVHKGDLKIAISTNGKSPTLARRMKEYLNDALPDNTQDLLNNMNSVRNSIVGGLPERMNALNALTADFVKKQRRPVYRLVLNWQTFVLTSLGMLALMLAGYFLFSMIPLDYFSALATELYAQVDSDFFLMLALGFIAQMIDGAFGMAYGVTVTSFLLSMGIPASMASASMHASEIFTTGTASLSYLRYKNVNAKLFRALVVPGSIGAIAGAISLSYVSKEYFSYIKPLVAIYTLLLGVVIIRRALGLVFKKKRKSKRIASIALVGGFLDSVGGGGWGPIVTSSLVAGGRNLRYTIGSAHLAKFFVATLSTLTFILFIGFHHWYIVLALVLGGMIAAPISIYFSNKIPSRTGLVLVGLVVIVISIRTIIYSIPL